MPRGVPNAGYRRTKNQMNGPVTTTHFTKQDTTDIPKSRFTINERFGFINDMVMMLARGEQPSVVITGPGGLGKSFSVLKALNTSGFTDISLADEYFTPSSRTFCVVKGHSSPRGLFRILWENKSGVIVFDDCDSVLKDPVSLNLLKGALDSYSRRIITWRSETKSDDDMPHTFEFKGRIVFISNMSSNALDQAIVTRSMVVDLSMTLEQKIERMLEIAVEDDFMPEYSLDEKQDAIELVNDLRETVKELSIRTLIQVIKIRNSSVSNWRNLAEYSICG